jgi:hypothetical protein
MFLRNVGITYKSARCYNSGDLHGHWLHCLSMGPVFSPIFSHRIEAERDTYSLSRTLLKNCIVDRCSSFPSGTDGFSNHELLNPGPSAVLRNSSYWSGSAKHVGATGREISAGRADSWLAVLHRPERLQRTLWTPTIRLTRCWGLMVRNPVLEKHSGSPSEKAKHSNSVQLVRCSGEEAHIKECSGYLSNYSGPWLYHRCRGTASTLTLYVKTTFI